MDGETVSPADFRGNKLVLYFYPKDDTSGCTREAQDFTALADEFEKAGTWILGVSKDSPAKHAKFTDKYGLKVRLASDSDGSGLRGVRHLGREEPLRPQIYGDRPGHLPDRPRRHDRPDLAQGEGARAMPRRCWRRHANCPERSSRAMSERGLRRFVVTAMTSRFALPVMGGSLLAAVALRHPARRKRDRPDQPDLLPGPRRPSARPRRAIDESNLPAPVRPAYRDLYGWDEGAAARAAECDNCSRSRVRDAHAYSAEVPYFGSREDLRTAVREARDELGESFAEAPDQVGARNAPMLRYAYYPITEEEAALAGSVDKDEGLFKAQDDRP